MKNSGNETHRPRAIDPVNFRAQATGIGQSLAASRRTGLNRAMQVAETIPNPACVPASEGFPSTPGDGETISSNVTFPSKRKSITANVVSMPLVVSPIALGRG